MENYHNNKKIYDCAQEQEGGIQRSDREWEGRGAGPRGRSEPHPSHGGAGGCVGTYLASWNSTLGRLPTQ